MANYKTEAIILARKNFGEADRLLTIFSKHYGLLRVLAKGVRRPTSRKGGSLELFNRVSLVLAKGKNLDLITEVAVKETYPAWRKNLIRVGVAYYLTELVVRLTAEEQKSILIFNLLRNSFKSLARADLIKLIREFEEQILTESGFGIPVKAKLTSGSLSGYIEEIIEGSLKSKQVLKRIKHG